MDFMDQERERGITISAAAISLDWKGTQVLPVLFFLFITLKPRVE